ncbi:MAG: zinc ABC transporter substrate-binding protein [Syntrophorhabdaceae bacterium]|nr:zinc ABC transporter substrate-binding protein [Syntrophorhabdaceae bacterium]
MKKNVIKIILLIVFFLYATISGCGYKSKELAENKLKIVTTLFPLYDFTKNITGDRAEVTLLLPPGVEAHSFEPKAGDILKVNSADIFIYTGRFMEPWSEDIVKSIDNKKLLIVDASMGIKVSSLDKTQEDHKDTHHTKYKNNNIDPHIWLDLSNVIIMVDNIVGSLIKKDPANKDFYQKKGEQYKVMIKDLDERFKKTLNSCKKRIIVHGGHFAFGYLAKRYDLEYVSAYKGSPNAEPTPKLVARMKKIIREKNVKYVFFEELITPRVAMVLSEETNTRLLKLHGCHNISKEEMDRGVTFLSLMEENLNNLKTGLECP